MMRGTKVPFDYAVFIIFGNLKENSSKRILSSLFPISRKLLISALEYFKNISSTHFNLCIDDYEILITQLYISNKIDLCFAEFLEYETIANCAEINGRQIPYPEEAARS